jgi:hypothetical protein
MMGAYYRDLETISLEELQQVLETGRLLPSERILREDVPGRIGALASKGIQNLKDLHDALRTKKRLQQFAQQSGLPTEYLTVLRRRAGSYTPRPVPLKKLPGIEAEHIEQLVASGIKDTKQLWERAAGLQDRTELAKEAGVPGEVLLELVKLSDVARAPWVGPAFARLLVDSGVDTIAKLSQQSADGLREQLIATNAETQVYRAPVPGGEDMAHWLDLVRQLPVALEE